MQILTVINNLTEQDNVLRKVLKDIITDYCGFILEADIEKIYKGKVDAYYDIALVEEVDEGNIVKLQAVNKINGRMLECLAIANVYEKSFTVRSKYLKDETNYHINKPSFVICLN